MAAFLEFSERDHIVEAQLHLRGQSYGELTVKPLYSRPAGPKPERRADGFGRRGPQGLQNIVGSKPSSMSGPLPPPPPLPPRPPMADPLADVPMALPLPKHINIYANPGYVDIPPPPVHPFPPPPPPWFVPPVPKYGPVPAPAHAYPPRIDAPYYRPKASSRYPFSHEKERAT